MGMWGFLNGKSFYSSTGTALEKERERNNMFSMPQCPMSHQNLAALDDESWLLDNDHTGKEEGIREEETSTDRRLPVTR